MHAYIYIDNDTEILQEPPEQEKHKRKSTTKKLEASAKLFKRTVHNESRCDSCRTIGPHHALSFLSGYDSNGV